MLHHYLRGGALLLSLSLAATVSASAQGKWRAGAPIPQGANEVIGGAIDGQMFVYGGQDSANKPMGIFWRYDPAKNEWASLPSNPVPVHHGASATVGRKFYVFGGFRLPDTGKVGWYPENKAWVFDLDTQKWSALPDMPTPRGALAAVAVGKKIYVTGGARISAGRADARRPLWRRPGRASRHQRGARHRDQHLVEGGGHADAAQPSQRRRRRRQDLRDRRPRRLVLLGRLVVQHLDERRLRHRHQHLDAARADADRALAAPASPW